MRLVVNPAAGVDETVCDDTVEIELAGEQLFAALSASAS